MKKTCFKCGRVLDISMYYKHKRMADGHLNKCKDCAKADANKHREENIDKAREYDRSRGMLPHRVLARKRYLKTPNGKEAIARGVRKYRKNNPEKYHATGMLNNAIRDGKIRKPSQCSICKSEGRVQGHHEDYYKPLEVIWCCEICHKEIHAKQQPLPEMAKDLSEVARAGKACD